MKQTIDFKSEFDGTVRQAIVVAPNDAGERPLPLVIVPHAAGYSAESTAAYWHHLPERRGVIAVFPIGHERRSPLFSMGWTGQIEDLAAMPRIISSLGFVVDMSRIYGIGISMGGQEVLLLAGRHPGVLAAIVAFNVAMDLRAWYASGDLARGILDAEIGGPPEDLPDEYAARSPMSYTATIARVPTLLVWDPNDRIVPHQDDQHSGLFYRRIRDEHPDAQIESQTHRRGHLWVNPGMALTWATGK
jgi:pimeloyl-ACP methyl ester carboxylesterase